jgi:copper chaperone NosL
MKSLILFLLTIMLVACGTSVPEPAVLDTRNDVCGTCRMTVSMQKFAAQVVAPGELPVFFDDIGCLARYLKEHPDLPRGAASFVADHRTGAWAPAASAVFTRAPGVETPMGSHLLAHATVASRDADPAARDGADVPFATIAEGLSHGAPR